MPVPRSALRARRLLVSAVFLSLLFLLLRASPSDLRSRVEILHRFGNQDLRTRRWAGSSAAFDRRFFEYLAHLKRAIPPDAKGLALYAPGVSERGGLYLAIYDFAPFPVLIAPAEVPEGWVAAVYGAPPPPGWRVLRELPNGALLARHPQT